MKYKKIKMKTLFLVCERETIFVPIYRDNPVFNLKKTFLDGNSVIGAQVKRNLCYLTSLRHLIRVSAVANRIFSKKNLFSLTLVLMGKEKIPH